MRSLIAAVVLALLLGGWGPCSRVVQPDPVAANCDAMCYVVDEHAPEDTACASRAVWKGDATDPKAIDALIYGTVPALRKETWTCGVRLRACQQCIDRLVKAGVVTKP
ncbi:MAG TPA: hypothetical protein VGE09_03355 [Pseudoxanthomonas sp.]